MTCKRKTMLKLHKNCLFKRRKQDAEFVAAASPENILKFIKYIRFLEGWIIDDGYSYENIKENYNNEFEIK